MGKKVTTVRRYVRVTGSNRHYVSKHLRHLVPPGWTRVRQFKNRPYLIRGMDEKGRWQYIYPEKHVEKQHEKKYERVIKLNSEIPKILARMNGDLKDDPEAQAIYTMYKTGFRPGSSKDTKADKEAFGTITLHTKHIKLRPKNTVEFTFIGKKGVKINKVVRDRRLASIIRARQHHKRLFDTNDEKVRRYFKKIAGPKYQLKDLRTLQAVQIAKATKSRDKKKVGEAVAKGLSNTPRVALDAYVPPNMVKKK